jgi:hypothetical protein
LIIAFVLLHKKYQKVQEEGTENHGGYGASLFDPRWKAKRVEILSRDGNQCKVCNSKESLQVHHRQYHFSFNSISIQTSQFRKRPDQSGSPAI